MKKIRKDQILERNRIVVREAERVEQSEMNSTSTKGKADRGERE